jgi:hypothetical protein
MTGTTPREAQRSRIDSRHLRLVGAGPGLGVAVCYAESINGQVIDVMLSRPRNLAAARGILLGGYDLRCHGVHAEALRSELQINYANELNKCSLARAVRGESRRRFDAVTGVT